MQLKQKILYTIFTHVFFTLIRMNCQKKIEAENHYFLMLSDVCCNPDRQKIGLAQEAICLMISRDSFSYLYSWTTAGATIPTYSWFFTLINYPGEVAKANTILKALALKSMNSKPVLFLPETSACFQQPGVYPGRFKETVA
jgi:hypothetical protein